MAELIRKVLDCEIKKLGDRNYEFTASTSTVDRDGEVIDAKGWDLKNFKKNPVIMYAHDYRSLPIGKAPRVWLTGGKLKNTVKFPPEGTYEFADIVERLVDTGYLKTESVGFIPKKWEDGDGEKFLEMESGFISEGGLMDFIVDEVCFEYEEKAPAECARCNDRFVNTKEVNGVTYCNNCAEKL